MEFAHYHVEHMNSLYKCTGTYLYIKAVVQKLGNLFPYFNPSFKFLGIILHHNSVIVNWCKGKVGICYRCACLVMCKVNNINVSDHKIYVLLSQKSSAQFQNHGT